ncbi:MAG: TetR/AcrR family transcriptional regulator [Deltaproteobacteria bacterium]|nr:MAG: TetR/AcrR family transcriptional regulator [Deltaproteobacteria bacterium]
MTDNQENTKDETFFKICNSVMKMEVAKGHLEWRLSDIAKDADVTRSLIYYYFGKEKDLILEEAFRYMIDLFYNLERKNSMNIIDRLNFVLGNLKTMPWVFVLFYLQKDADNKIGELIRNAEARLLEIFQEDYPELDETAFKKLYVLQLGCVAHKGLSEQDVAGIFMNELQRLQSPQA